MVEDNHQILFMQLVIQNQQKGLISLGKVKNPASDALDKKTGICNAIYRYT